MGGPILKLRRRCAVPMAAGCTASALTSVTALRDASGAVECVPSGRVTMCREVSPSNVPVSKRQLTN
jgi:hypothetical protein